MQRVCSPLPVACRGVVAVLQRCKKVRRLPLFSIQLQQTIEPGSFCAGAPFTAHSMAGHSTMIQQRPCKALLPTTKAPRPERMCHRVMAQAQPAKPSQPSRANTALQASAVADAPPAHTSRVSEKPLGEGPTVINGQVQAMRMWASTGCLFVIQWMVVGKVSLSQCLCICAGASQSWQRTAGASEQPRAVCPGACSASVETSREMLAASRLSARSKQRRLSGPGTSQAQLALSP